MIPFERRNIIIDALTNKDVVTIEELCKCLGGISESTVRRDLNSLEKEGLVENLRGGATRLCTGSFDTSVSTRKTLNAKEKEKIAKKAAELVNDGDCIYIDVGSTTVRMIKYLTNKRITIVTTDARVVQEISDTKLECMLVGGDVIKNTCSLVGPMTDNILKGLFFDKSFIGTFGFDINAGFSCPDYRESNKKKIVKENSKVCYMLADHTKEGKRSLSKAFDLSDCILITDVESELVKQYTKYIIAE